MYLVQVRNVTSKKRRILVVDDELDILLTFKSCLERNKFKVDVFSDPHEALSNFTRGAYDLLLLDIKMPKMNGFELYREIRKLDDNVKVCFITAFVVYYQSLQETFPSTKTSCFIRKPIELNQLIKKIDLELG